MPLPSHHVSKRTELDGLSPVALAGRRRRARTPGASENRAIKTGRATPTVAVVPRTARVYDCQAEDLRGVGLLK